MQRGGLVAVQLAKLVAKTFKLSRKPAGAGLRPRAAKHGKLQRFDRGLEAGRRASEPAQRMFQKRKQRRWLEAARDGFCGQPCKDAGRRLDQRLAAGIIE